MVPGILGVLAILAFIALMIYITARINRKRAECWQQLSERVGGTLSSSKRPFSSGLNYTISGWYNEREFRIFESVRGSGKNKRYYANIDLAFSPGFDFSISRENILTKIGAAMGFSDISFQNGELDKSFRFKSSEEDRFRRMMTMDQLNVLTGIQFKFTGALTGKNEMISYSVQMQLINQKNVDELQTIMNFMCGLVDV